MQPQLIFGNSKRFHALIERAELFAKTDWPILLLGETGTGKELLARKIHADSLRVRGPFVPVNTAAMPSGLVESELFGYERGAFSGAVTSYRGLVRSASGGTLFLDEIGDLDLSQQVKLLRLLDSQEVRSIGASRTETANVRVLAATNVDLLKAVSEGKFRLDLLERLSVLKLEIPPLRQRMEDVPLIAHSILHSIGTPPNELLYAALQRFEWPGNARQLRNVLVRASVLCSGTPTNEAIECLIEEEKRALESSTTSVLNNKTSGTLENIEKQVIVERLKRYHGNRKKTAEELGIAKSTLHEKLRKWRETGETHFPEARTLPYAFSLS